MVKTLIWLGLFVGSTLGGLIPGMWGDSMFSGWALLLSAAGGFLGIWAGYRLGRML